MRRPTRPHCATIRRFASRSLQELLAAEEVKENQAAYFPTADAFGDAVDAGNRNTRILAGGVSNPAIYDRVADGLSVNELITDFGQTQQPRRRGQAFAKAADGDAAATNQQILLNVDANYFNVLQTQAVLQRSRAKRSRPARRWSTRSPPSRGTS